MARHADVLSLLTSLAEVNRTCHEKSAGRATLCVECEGAGRSAVWDATGRGQHASNACVIMGHLKEQHDSPWSMNSTIKNSTRAVRREAQRFSRSSCARSGEGSGMEWRARVRKHVLSLVAGVLIGLGKTIGSLLETPRVPLAQS